MSEETKNENADVQQNVETQNNQKNPEPEKTFTLSEVQALLNAKNHEKEARKTAEAELKNLREENAKLKGEDSVTKYNQEQYNQLKAELESLKKEKEDLEFKNSTNALKDELRKMNGLNQAAIDDVVDKALKRGFKKSDEVGLYLDKDGKTIDDFTNDLRNSHPYYFGISQNKNVVPEALQKQIDNAKKTGNTLGLIQEAFKTIDLRELK